MCLSHPQRICSARANSEWSWATLSDKCWEHSLKQSSKSTPSSSLTRSNQLATCRCNKGEETIILYHLYHHKVCPSIGSYLSSHDLTLCLLQCCSRCLLCCFIFLSCMENHVAIWDLCTQRVLHRCNSVLGPYHLVIPRCDKSLLQSM